VCKKCVTNPGIKNLLYLIERVEFSIEVQFNKLTYQNKTLNLLESTKYIRYYLALSSIELQYK